MKNIVTADSSVMIDYFKGINNKETKLVYEMIEEGALILPPMVISELLSNHELDDNTINAISVIPTFDVKDGFWIRSGFSRAKVLSKKLKARMLDVQIAQICIDNDVTIVTRDKDFRHFKKYLGLKIYDFK